MSHNPQKCAFLLSQSSYCLEKYYLTFYCVNHFAIFSAVLWYTTETVKVTPHGSLSPRGHTANHLIIGSAIFAGYTSVTNTGTILQHSRRVGTVCIHQCRLTAMSAASENRAKRIHTVKCHDSISLNNNCSVTI